MVMEVWLADKPLIASTLSTLTATLDHSSCPPLPSPMSIQSGWHFAIDLTASASADTQLAAQLLLAALGVPAKVQLTLDVAVDGVAFSGPQPDASASPWWDRHRSFATKGKADVAYDRRTYHQYAGDAARNAAIRDRQFECEPGHWCAGGGKLCRAECTRGAC